MSDEDFLIRIAAYLVALFILGVIIYHFYRYVFSINKQLDNQDKMIAVLFKIAEKQGVDEDDLLYIKKMHNKVAVPIKRKA